jgi:hypothetical protein
MWKKSTKYKDGYEVLHHFDVRETADICTETEIWMKQNNINYWLFEFGTVRITNKEHQMMFILRWL